MKKNLAIAAGALVLLSAALWFFVLQPEREAVSHSSAELLADGIGHYERKEYELALEVLRQVPDDDAWSAQARYYEGSSYMMLEDYEAAAASLESALVHDPQDTGVLYALGVAYYKLGNLALAKAYFGEVLKINPNDEHAKGLMDIMAKLERESGAPAESE
jgi:tetratricopeptide (TPR) repeat protein